MPKQLTITKALKKLAIPLLSLLSLGLVLKVGANISLLSNNSINITIHKLGSTKNRKKLKNKQTTDE